MDPFEGVHVEVISGGKALDLYNDPDEEPGHDPRVRQRYVEAVTGATFQVKVSITGNFLLLSLGPNDAVRATITYDGQAPSWYSDIPMTNLLAARATGGSVAHTFLHIATWCNNTQQWKQGETTFGTLVMNTSVASASVPEVQDLGSIKLQVQRVHRTKHDTPVPAHKQSSKVITEISEKILKGKAIANTVCTSNETASKGPPPSQYHIKPLYGDDSQPLIYNVFYRSKHTLQMLGCIPRTPSPEAEIIPNNTNITAREQERQALRAQLAYLEHADNIKAEGSNPNVNIKREREQAENAASRKRPRNSGPVTIDLTGDD